MQTHKTTVLAVVMGLLLAVGGVAEAGSVGVNFRRDNGSTLMAATDVAGVVPQANWNNGPTAASGTEVNIVGPTAGVLVDDTNTPTGMTMRFSAPGTWSVGTGGSGGAADKNMMTGYLDMTGGGAGQIINIDLANIPYSSYDVYLYHSSAGGANRTMSALADDGSGPMTLFTRNLSPADQFNGFVPDQHLTLAGSNASNSGGNYVLFEGLTGSTLHLETQGIGASDGGFPGSGDTRRGPVQGIQIVDTGEVPEPLTMLGVFLGVGGLAGYVRRRRTA